MSYLSVSRKGFLKAEQSQQASITETMTIYREATKEINSILQDLYNKMSEAGIDPDRYQAYVNKSNRLTKLNKEITAAYKRNSKLAGKSTQSGLTTAMKENYNRQQYATSWLSPELVAKPINDKLLAYSVTGNVDVWKKIQSDSFEKVWGNPGLYSPQSGTLTQLLTDNATKELNSILRTVQNGLITGKSYNEQAKSIKAIIGSYARKAGKEQAKGAMYNALRIARTEGLRVMNAGALADANQSIAQGVEIKKRWISTLDSRTRESHISMDGQEVNVNDNFSSSVTGATGQAPGQMSQAGDNINCRCSMIEIVEGFEPETRSARNPVTGETELISYKNYDEWLADNNL